MAYIKPADVISPKANWHLFDAILDRGEGECAYALGTWNGERRVGFRWNGEGENILGNPQSRGLPTWTMLDSALHDAVLSLLPTEKRALAKNFLGIRAPEELHEITAAARKLHLESVAGLSEGKWQCGLQDGGRLLLQVIPFAAVDGSAPRSFPELFKDPSRFPPISGGSRPTPPADSRIGFDGLLSGSNGSGLGQPQRASVHVSRSGVVESVVSVALGQNHEFIECPKILQIIIRYARAYAKSLSECGVEFPLVVFVSLENVEGTRLLQDMIESGTLPVDIPCGFLTRPIYTFSETIFDSVPSTEGESATLLRPALDHICHTANLPGALCFDVSGSYIFRDHAW